MKVLFCPLKKLKSDRKHESMFYFYFILFFALPIFLGCSCSSGAEARLLLPVCQSPRNSSTLSDRVCSLIVGIYSSALRSICKGGRKREILQVPISLGQRLHSGLQKSNSKGNNGTAFYTGETSINTLT